MISRGGSGEGTAAGSERTDWRINKEPFVCVVGVVWVEVVCGGGSGSGGGGGDRKRGS